MLVDRRSSRTRGSSASLFVAQALLLVAAAARIVAKQPAADPDDDAVERLTADLKDNLKAQLRAREFNSAAIAHQLQQSYAKLRFAGRRQGTNDTLVKEDTIDVSNFQCSSCLFQEDANGIRSLRPIVAMFMADEKVCNNAKALALLKKQGLTLDACNYRKTAIPECFVAENWDSGWICEVTHGMFRDMGVSVIAKTKANTTVPTSVYNGPSSFTRCVYEVKLEQVDLCVGDFWETAQRRALAPFTSAVDLDSMKLITMPMGGLAAAQGYSPWLSDNSLLWTWTMPFAWEVWVTSVGMIVLAALSMWAVEQGHEQYHEPGVKHYDGYWAFPYKLWLATMGIMHRPPIRAVVEGHASDVKDAFGRQRQAATWAGECGKAPDPTDPRSLADRAGPCLNM